MGQGGGGDESRFTALSDPEERTVPAVRKLVSGQWQFWNGSAWANFTRDADDGLVALVEADSTSGITRIKMYAANRIILNDLTDLEDRKISTLEPADVPPGTTNDGGVIPRLGQAGTTNHTKVTTFGTAYSAPPIIRQRGGGSYHPDSAKWTFGTGTFNSAKAQYIDLRAANVTNLAFACVALLYQESSAAPTEKKATSAWTPATTLSSVGASAVVLHTADLPSLDDKYDVCYDITVNVSCPNDPEDPDETGHVDVAVDVQDTVALGYIERNVTNYFHSQSWEPSCTGDDVNLDNIIQVTVTGLDGTEDGWRVRIKAETDANMDVDPHAPGETIPGVPWDVLGAATQVKASMTPLDPEDDDAVEWDALQS